MPDYVTSTIQRLAALLVANAWIADTIRPGNQLLKIGGIRWPEKPRKASGDFPELIINVPRNDVQNANAAKTFANATGAACDRIVVKQITFQFVVTWGSLDVTKPNKLLSVMEGILLQNPTLGITSPTVQESGKFTSRTGPSPINKNRLEQRIDFPITFRLRQADLIAATQS